MAVVRDVVLYGGIDGRALRVCGLDGQRVTVALSADCQLSTRCGVRLEALRTAGITAGRGRRGQSDEKSECCAGGGGASNN